MTKRNKLIYWIATIWLSLGMVSTAIVQLVKMKEETDMMTRLGYPGYVLTIIGIWKLLGVVALLMPRFPVLKEWAYAGFFFLTTGAIFSHIAAGNAVQEVFPSLLLLILTIISWYFRPADRKVINAATTIRHK